LPVSTIMQNYWTSFHKIWWKMTHGPHKIIRFWWYSNPDLDPNLGRTVASDRHKCVSNHERKSNRNPNPDPDRNPQHNPNHNLTITLL